MIYIVENKIPICLSICLCSDDDGDDVWRVCAVAVVRQRQLGRRIEGRQHHDPGRVPGRLRRQLTLCGRRLGRVGRQLGRLLDPHGPQQSGEPVQRCRSHPVPADSLYLHDDRDHQHHHHHHSHSNQYVLVCSSTVLDPRVVAMHTMNVSSFISVLCHSGARFTKYLKIYRKAVVSNFVIRLICDSDLLCATISL